MILESHFRLTLYVLSCFSLAAVHLTGAAPTMEPSITAELYPRCRFQRPRLFFPASDSHTSITILHVQPNDAEVHKAMPNRLYTCCITCYSAFMSIPQGSFAMELLWYYYSCIWLERVEQSKTGGFFSFGVSFEEKT